MPIEEPPDPGDAAVYAAGFESGSDLSQRILLDDHARPPSASLWPQNTKSRTVPNWDRVIPFFAFPEAVRKIIYTTNAIEALNAKLRRAVRIRGISRRMRPPRS